MKASRLQYFFAGDWPVTIWMTVIPLMCFVILPVSYIPVLVEFGTWPHVLVLLGIAVLSLPLGFFGAILTSWFTLGPVYYRRAIKNGEPFHKGDLVLILAGSHRDRVVRVETAWDDAPWAGAHRIRLDLGETERQDQCDVFRSYQIVRVARAETDARNASSAERPVLPGCLPAVESEESRNVIEHNEPLSDLLLFLGGIICMLIGLVCVLYINRQKIPMPPMAQTFAYTALADEVVIVGLGLLVFSLFRTSRSAAAPHNPPAPNRDAAPESN